jgi:hypothetical protein
MNTYYLSAKENVFTFLVVHHVVHLASDIVIAGERRPATTIDRASSNRMRMLFMVVIAVKTAN